MWGTCIWHSVRMEIRGQFAWLSSLLPPWRFWDRIQVIRMIVSVLACWAASPVLGPALTERCLGLCQDTVACCPLYWCAWHAVARKQIWICSFPSHRVLLQCPGWSAACNSNSMYDFVWGSSLPLFLSEYIVRNPLQPGPACLVSITYLSSSECFFFWGGEEQSMIILF